ncbi:MAG: hypothetical protein IPP31_08720 [Chitinophagaceae bacterium]|nr:hypothetical protein [Chitinophagaceae bacterium]
MSSPLIIQLPLIAPAHSADRLPSVKEFDRFCMLLFPELNDQFQYRIRASTGEGT